jgi:hypothetical protein
MEHPPYSSDQALDDLGLFPKIRSALKGWRYQDTENIQKKKKKVMTELKDILQQEFQKCFNGGSNVWQSAKLLKGSTPKRWPLSVSCKYTGTLGGGST